MSASRAHGCLSPARASCLRTRPGLSLSSRGLAPSSRTLTACGTQSQDSLPTPGGETPASAPPGRPQAHHRPAGSPQRKDRKPHFAGQGHIRARTANFRTCLVITAATSGGTRSWGAGRKGQGTKQTSTRTDSCGSSSRLEEAGAPGPARDEPSRGGFSGCLKSTHGPLWECARAGLAAAGGSHACPRRVRQALRGFARRPRVCVCVCVCARGFLQPLPWEASPAARGGWTGGPPQWCVGRGLR